ncbi:uncharacterized protein LOC134233018 [Saccostrea cucullata]|uniref:uncharacterized protein LOC134233018 n=1 Tax=Saccostrea cuccullata TaxID=36930 RepID=UPI002ED35488
MLGIVGNTSMSNSTTPSKDFIMAGCLINFNTVACIRSSILTFLAVVTGIVCIFKVVRLHLMHHPAWHQYVIFYTASLECTIAGVHWVLVQYAQMDFVLQYLKLIQFLVMCHFYWTLATRALRRERLTKWFLIPFLILVCVYFTVIATLGIVNVEPAITECLQPYWLELSGAEFATVQLFMVAGFYITRRLNEISTLDSVRWSQKRDLWCIIIVFEISAFIGFMYDLTLQIIGNESNGCGNIFGGKEELFSSVFLVFMVLKLLLPIWVMLFVFQATPVVNEPDDLVPALSDDGNSLFGSIDDHQYRQLYHPTEDYNSFRDNSPSPNRPSVNITKSSSSNLDPIREEGSSGSDQNRTATRGRSQPQRGPEAIVATRPPAEDERETPPSQRGKFYI